jgi:type IV pilus assembly protein PilE
LEQRHSYTANGQIILVLNMKQNKGFSLVELMVVVAIIGILVSVALPAYTDYLIKGRLAPAKANLSEMRIKVEQRYSDTSSSYTNAPICNALPTSEFFNFSCALNDDTYTLTATGKSAMNGFVLTINEKNEKKTTGTGSGWTTPSGNCWVSNKAGSCD